MAEKKQEINGLTVVLDTVDFELDKSELEVLAKHYFTVRVDYTYDQFAYPSDSISTSEWNRYMFAGLRLEAIKAVLGEERITELKTEAEHDFIRRWDISVKNWTDFTAPRVQQEIKL